MLKYSESKMIKEKFHCSQAQVGNISTANAHGGAVDTGQVGTTQHYFSHHQHCLFCKEQVLLWGFFSFSCYKQGTTSYF